MEDLERECLKENMRLLERWENSPAAPSGRCSDLTEVEKEKLIDLLFANNEKMTSELSGLRQAMERQTEELRQANESSARFEQRAISAEQRAVAAERRAEQKSEREAAERKALQAKIDELLALVKRLQDGSELKAALARAEKAERECADMRSADRALRGQTYGSKSQKDRRGRDEGDDEGGDAQQEKDNMGGKDSVKQIPAKATADKQEGIDTWVEGVYRSKRAYRKGSKNRTMKAERRCIHRSDKSLIPEGWTLLREEKRFAYDKVTVIVEHEYRYFVVRNPEGKECIMFLPKGKGEQSWVETKNGEERQIDPVAPVSDYLRDKEGSYVMDWFPGTHATSGMMAQLVIDHFVNNIPYYRLSRHFNDNGMSVCRQTLINWLYEGGNVLKRLIPLMLDMAVEKDSIINCDETWCKVRVKGKFRKRYTWCLVNKDLKMVIYVYKDGARSRAALKDILGDRTPKAIQSDGYNVYLYLDDELVDIEHLCCMAHARAKVFYAWVTNHEPDAEYILRIIQELYALEDHYKKLQLPPGKIWEFRNGDRTNELIIQLRSKIDAMKMPGHPPRSELLEKAIRYIDDFWKQLFAYRHDGRYDIDNTLAERFMRPIAGERKNSLFYVSDKMAVVSAVYRTLISTCRLMKVSVTEYFHKVFRKIVAGYDNLTSLLPMNMGFSVNNY